jgi:hypothetical protein
VLGGTFFTVASSAIIFIYSGDDIQAILSKKVSKEIANIVDVQEQSYFYSLGGNVVETSEAELINTIKLSPNSEHMVFNSSTQTWNSWKTYPKIYRLVNEQPSNNQQTIGEQ